jgi:hypothetical protein
VKQFANFTTIAALLLVVLCLLVCPSGDAATMSYQGRLASDVDSTGGTQSRSMTFSFYTSSSAGAANRSAASIWEETHPSVDIGTDGTFQVQLGSIVEYDIGDAQHDSLWLEIEVDGEVLLPRIQVSAVPWAFRSFDNQGNEGGFWRDTGDAIHPADTTKKVGIGLSNPAEMLDVAGNIHASGALISGNSITVDGIPNTITSTSGKISFDDEDLETTGILRLGDATLIPSSEHQLDVWAKGKTAARFQSGDGPNSFYGGLAALYGVGHEDHDGGSFSAGGSGMALGAFNWGGTGYAAKFGGDGLGVHIGGDLEVTETLKLPSGATDGHVLTSDASGNASWQSPGGGGGGANGWVDDGTAVRLETTTDNVGIGTSTPSSKLYVVGEVGGDNSGTSSSTILALGVTANNFGSGRSVGGNFYGLGSGEGIHMGLKSHAGGSTADNRGIWASASANSGSAYGVFGFGEIVSDGSGTAHGAYCNSYNFGTGDCRGVYAYAQASSGDAFGAKLAAVRFGGAGSNYGVFASASTSGGVNYGVYGTASSGTTNWAGYFSGNVHVTGTLSKGAGSFKIDHPLDPENKYLSHSFVESPDMMNVYNGNITTDAVGQANIELPEYFSALNKDFRYQLTVIGQFAQAIISNEITGNQFSILTDKPNVKVSWQVTGVRKDAFAEANRIQVEVAKPDNERGRYLHPKAFGLGEELDINYEQNQQAMQGVIGMDQRDATGRSR